MFEHQEGQNLSVSFHIVIEHCHNNNLIQISDLEFSVTEIHVSEFC